MSKQIIAYSPQLRFAYEIYYDHGPMIIIQLNDKAGWRIKKLNKTGVQILFDIYNEKHTFASSIEVFRYDPKILLLKHLSSVIRLLYDIR